MKYLITERQFKLIKEDEDKILKLDFDFFNKKWDILQKFLERRGNPPYIITGDVSFPIGKVKTLGSLVGVEGSMFLSYNKTIKDLGNLVSVGGYFYLYNSKIESLGNLQYVGGDLFLRNTPLSETTTEDEIRSQVEVGGDIYI